MPIQHSEQVWYPLLDAERLTRYYGHLATRFRRLQFVLNMFIAASTTGAAVSLLAQLPDQVSAWLSAGLFFMVAVGVAWMSYADYSKKATTAFIVSKQCGELALAWRQLWWDMDAPDATKRAQELELRLNQITNVEIDIDDDLNQQCAEEAYATCQAEFAS